MTAKTYATKLAGLLASALRHPETYHFADCYAFMIPSLLTKNQQPSQQRNNTVPPLRQSTQSLFTQTRYLPPSSHQQLRNNRNVNVFKLEAFRGR